MKQPQTPIRTCSGTQHSRYPVSAAERLIATYATEHKDKVESLFEKLIKKVPAKLNKIDYSIGITCETPRVIRVMDMLGFGRQKRNDRILFENGSATFELREPRDGWNPVLYLLK
jgi:hypothetical protein